MKKIHVWLYILFFAIGISSLSHVQAQAPFSLTISAGYSLPGGDIDRTHANGFSAALAGDLFIGPSVSFGLAGAYSSFSRKKDENYSYSSVPSIGITEIKAHGRLYFANYPPNSFYIEAGGGFFQTHIKDLASESDFGTSFAFGRMFGSRNGTVGLLLEVSTQAAADYSYIGLRLGLFTFSGYTRPDDGDNEFE